MINFTLPSSSGKDFDLAKISKPIVIFFYPKDNTPGCTIENQDFAKHYKDFTKLGYEIIGISRDSVNSHCKFRDSFSLPFELISDPDETACNLFKVIKNKNMYGKTVRGIERSTFILDKDKNIIKEWRAVKVPNHVNEVLDFIKNHK